MSRPHGARGLKLESKNINIEVITSRPHGARGLKYFEILLDFDLAAVAPARGAWIEIC